MIYVTYRYLYLYIFYVTNMSRAQYGSQADILKYVCSTDILRSVVLVVDVEEVGRRLV